MRLGIMQPYFFPYAGYFDLVLKSDLWIVFDVVKYRPKTWMNRNRILDQNSGWQYISVPVNRKSGALISEITLAEFDHASRKIVKQLETYRGHAPFFEAVSALVQGAFARFGKSGLLRDLNVLCLEETCQYLGIPFDHLNCSELGVDFSGVDHAGAWAREISKQLKATAYLNPPGGVEIFRPAEWTTLGITLEFTGMPDLTYPVGKPFEFLPNASILDVMMWCSPDDIRAHLARLPTHPPPTSGESFAPTGEMP